MLSRDSAALRTWGEMVVSKRTTVSVLVLAVVGVALMLQQLRRPAEVVTPGASGPPNIVLLIIDTLRADLLGCYGCQEDLSPEIDEMAREGVRFENVIAQCSWTRPSTGSMVTALYPRTLGIYKEQFDILADEHLTLAEILKERGYRTLGITANPNINRVFGFDQGFDEYSESTVVWSWMNPEDGQVQEKPGELANLPRSREIFNWVLGKAREADDRPAYVQINVMEVHSPNMVREEFRPLAAEYAQRDSLRPGWTGPRNDIVWRTYMAVRQVSHDTGIFVRELAALPGWENTLFVITSDHGQGLDDHPDVYDSTRHGNLLYGSQVAVPLILYNPGDPDLAPTGRRIPGRVRLLDMMPTILDYAGVPVAGDVAGKSLLPLVTGGSEAPELPTVFVGETNWRNVHKIAAYGKSWTYIENRDGWHGVNEFEIQRVGVTENGKRTDQISERRDIAEMLRLALERWEGSYDRADPVSPAAGPSGEEIEQLKSLGYIQ